MGLTSTSWQPTRKFRRHRSSGVSAAKTSGRNVATNDTHSRTIGIHRNRAGMAPRHNSKNSKPTRNRPVCLHDAQAVSISTQKEKI